MATAHRIRIRDTLIRVLSIIGLILLWYGVVWFYQPPLLPSPTAVLDRLLQELGSGMLWLHLASTLRRVAIAFILAMSLGFMLGALMGRYGWVDRTLDGLLVVTLNLPALVVILLSFIWLGLNELAAILAVVINKTPTMAVIFREGVRSIDRTLLEVAQVYRLPAARRFFSVWLPQLYPYCLAATRSGLALVWKIVLVVELIGTSEGMGFKLGEFFQFFDIEGVLAYALTFVTIILFIESVVLRPWERRMSRWRG